MRSRAAFKLEEIDAAEKLIFPGAVVVDLGAAPGGWSQYAARRLPGSGRVFALDLLPMDAIPGVTFLQGDFREQAALDALLAELGPRARRPCDVRHGPQHQRGGRRGPGARGGSRVAGARFRATVLWRRGACWS